MSVSVPDVVLERGVGILFRCLLLLLLHLRQAMQDGASVVLESLAEPVRPDRRKLVRLGVELLHLRAVVAAESACDAVALLFFVSVAPPRTAAAIVGGGS
eukprot:6518234-Lingulodinium_polyedra.AAC.1